MMKPREGGKGLGKGGAKRHRKILRDNIQDFFSFSPLSLDIELCRPGDGGLMSKCDERFTGLAEDSSQGRPRPRAAASGGQSDKFRQNRAQLEFSDLQPSRPGATGSGIVPDSDHIDLFLGNNKEGSIDPTSPAKKGHFQPANVDIDEIERKMMADAPKAQESTYKIEDVFDQSFKDLLKDGTTTLASQSICAAGKASEDDEFDVF